MKRKMNEEEEHQKLVAEYLDNLRILWCHVPNGGKRSKATAGSLKAQGVKAGVPDILIFESPTAWAGPYIKGVAIELKKPKAPGYTLNTYERLTCSALTPEQKAWLADLGIEDWLCRVCFGFDEVRELCLLLGYERRR